ncbi:hypothetical protein COOONC_24985 [Cooperia oncophora]
MSPGVIPGKLRQFRKVQSAEVYEKPIMEKIRAELAAVTNHNRSISLSDKDHTPYLNWTLLEIHRLAAILNLNLFRRTKESRIVGGHSNP